MVKQRFTLVPKEFLGVDLFDWERGGLRIRGNYYIRVRSVKGIRPRKTFNDDWLNGLTKLMCPCDRKLLICVKSITDEVWVVYSRKGSYWRRDYYLVPCEAVIIAYSEIQSRYRKVPKSLRGFGKKIVQARNETSRASVARAAGLTESFVRRVEEGLVRNPSWSKLSRLFSVLNISSEPNSTTHDYPF